MRWDPEDRHVRQLWPTLSANAANGPGVICGCSAGWLPEVVAVLRRGRYGIGTVCRGLLCLRLAALDAIGVLQW